MAGAALIGAFTVVPSLAGADSPPSLPPISAQDLLVKVQQASVPGFSGKITSTPHLGLPDLGSVLGGRGGGIATSLLTGSHTVSVWEAGTNVRVSLPSELAEQDLIRNGDDVWVWGSMGQQVTHLKLAADTTPGAPEAADPTEVAPTPQALADHFLSSVDPTTRVFVRDTVTVAGRPAYELVLAPRSGTTLVADVIIAVDSATGVPLRAQILSRDSGTPALDVGFSSVDFSVPAASTFAFTPPPGATVTEATSPAQLLLPADNGGDHRGRHVKGTPGATTPDPAPAPGQPDATADPQVVGTGWDSIAVIDLGPDAGTTSNLAILDKIGRRVQGPWGSGRLVHTTLVNLLLTDNHTLLVGSVPEEALEAAAVGH